MSPTTKAALLVALASMFTGCQTLSGGPPADAPFASDLEFRSWFAYYYRDPQPERLTAALRYMQANHYLDEYPDISSVFLAKILAAHDERLAAWGVEWRDLGPEVWDVLLVSLWFVDTPASRSVMRENLQRCGAERRERIAAMLEGHPSKTELYETDATEPRQINLLWAAYSATGDERYIHKIVDHVHLYGIEDDGPEAAVGEAAIMSLANNSLQHEAVARICVEQNRAHPNPKTRILLQAMMKAVAQMVDEGLKERRTEPAH